MRIYLQRGVEMELEEFKKGLFELKPDTCNILLNTDYVKNPIYDYSIEREIELNNSSPKKYNFLITSLSIFISYFLKDSCKIMMRNLNCNNGRKNKKMMKIHFEVFLLIIANRLIYRVGKEIFSEKDRIFIMDNVMHKLIDLNLPAFHNTLCSVGVYKNSNTAKYELIDNYNNLINKFQWFMLEFPDKDNESFAKTLCYEFAKEFSERFEKNPCNAKSIYLIMAMQSDGIKELLEEFQKVYKYNDGNWKR